MCLYKIAKKINIYNRDPQQFTYIDTVSTYSFIIGLCIIVYLYTYRYYHLVEMDIELCNDNDTKYNCVKSEVINVIIPYIGIMFGFTQTFFMACDKISILFNYLFCCIYCCKRINPNIPQNKSSLTEIHLNNI